MRNVLTAFVIGGFSGWLIENLLFGERYSHVFGKERKIPFLPVYGLGSVGVVLGAPKIKRLPAPVRIGTYAAGLSALEYGACQLDRAMGTPSWDYGQGACIDLPHAVLWGFLALVIEP